MSNSDGCVSGRTAAYRAGGRLVELGIAGGPASAWLRHGVRTARVDRPAGRHEGLHPAAGRVVNDPPNPLSLPTDARREACTAALLAVEWVIGKRGEYLDLLGPLELLKVCLDEAEARFDAQTPQECAQ